MSEDTFNIVEESGMRLVKSGTTVIDLENIVEILNEQARTIRKIGTHFDELREMREDNMF